MISSNLLTVSHTNCLQGICSSGQSTVMHKSHAINQALVMRNMWWAMAQPIYKVRVEITFILASSHYLNPLTAEGGEEIGVLRENAEWWASENATYYTTVTWTGTSAWQQALAMKADLLSITPLDAPVHVLNGWMCATHTSSMHLPQQCNVITQGAYKMVQHATISPEIPSSGVEKRRTTTKTMTESD